ncbi:MAG: GntR family transcriptional regulator [Bauldia sp.]
MERRERISAERAKAEPEIDPHSAEAMLARLGPQTLARENGPLYRQMEALLRGAIEAGTLPIGASLPREADLASRFGVSLITVRQALRELEGLGFIRKRSAKTSIVASPRARAKSELAFQSFAAIAASTEDRRLEIISFARTRAAIAAEKFGLKRDAYCACLQGVIRRNDLPVSLVTFYFPPDIGKRLKRSDFDDVVIFRAVQRHLGIRFDNVQITMRAEAADEELARMLDYEVGAPVLSMEMLYLTADGEPVELSINRNRADRFSASFTALNDLT